MDITMQGLLIGLFAIAIGLAFAFYGFRVFLVLLPIWGFFAGFVLGATAMDALFPDSGFLVEVSSWVLGFILGLVFAVLSYLYYWVAIILLGGVLGYQLTYGVFQWIGFDNADNSILVFILALVVGAVFAVGFMLLRMPAVVVIVVTAISGAGATIAGVVIALGLVPLQELDGGIFGVYEPQDLGIVWLIAAIALAFAGAIYQTRAVSDLSARISADTYRNPGMGNQPPSGAAPA
jgi:Domain of unknown function (DUF4203)